MTWPPPAPLLNDCIQASVWLPDAEIDEGMQQSSPLIPTSSVGCKMGDEVGTQVSFISTCDLTHCVDGESFVLRVKWTNMEINNQIRNSTFTCTEWECLCHYNIKTWWILSLMGPLACRKKPVIERSYLKWFAVINKRPVTSEEQWDSYWLIHLQTQPSLCRSAPSCLTISSSSVWMSPLCGRI